MLLTTAVRYGSSDWRACPFERRIADDLTGVVVKARERLSRPEGGRNAASLLLLDQRLVPALSRSRGIATSCRRSRQPPDRHDHVWLSRVHVRLVEPGIRKLLQLLVILLSVLCWRRAAASSVSTPSNRRSGCAVRRSSEVRHGAGLTPAAAGAVPWRLPWRVRAGCRKGCLLRRRHRRMATGHPPARATNPTPRFRSCRALD
jgi:hypothetical protein